ncbi:MAG: iron complex outermembrane receptor protein [Spirosomataceae bacterium]|jgi:iron complex outermembrane receptor protein
MSLFNKFLFLFFLSGNLIAQNCPYSISGTITDELTGSPLAFAGIYLEETQQGVLADDAGNYKIQDICQKEVHVRVTHASCEPERFFIDLQENEVKNFLLHHHAELLNEVQVHGSSNEKSTQVSSSLGKVEIVRNGNQNLADILSELTGVSTLKNGSGISKPVIHGLFGNRISILNNGIAQSGQQWGSDHAPEIDAFSADHLSVIKGVNALAYAGSTLGGVVMVEGSPVEDEPHLHGSVNYLYNSNGRGNTLNAKVEKAGKWFRWRMNGTVKMQGDSKTPTYFLTNTGRKEANFSFRADKKLNDKWSSTLNYATFNTEIGILKGSQIGNLTDLETAFNREIPFFTETGFSYSIDVPKQRVSHNLLKLELNGVLSPTQTLRFVYGGQLNNRREFDARRGDRSEKPVLSLNQWSHFFEGKYINDLSENKTLITGIQQTITDNANIPETGISPLIPDYLAYQTSLFGILNVKNNRWFHEFGFRAENKQLNVAQITRTVPRTIKRINQNFTFFSVSAGSQLTLPNHLILNGNVGLAMRPPEVNELYSFGLHQGVSSIEEGNADLKPEKSIKALITANYHKDDFLLFEITPYAQLIDNFIYLQPQREFLLTIRGAFPYFRFEQADALLLGIDALVSIEPTDKIKLINKLTFVHGKNLTDDVPLINIPPLNFSSALQVSFKNIGVAKNNTIEVEVSHTAQQSNLLASQDFVLSPDAYTLLNLRFDTTIEIKKYYISFGLKAANLLNISYRDYLNRLRYFADDTGRNFTLSSRFTF